MGGLSGSVEQACGAVLFLLVLVDIFLTVLYARAGASVFSRRLASAVWAAFRLVSKPFGRRRGLVLSLAAPASLVLLVLAWAFGLTLGAALIIHPVLGTAVTASSGPTPTDFVTALYAGGTSLAITGGSDYGPKTAAFKLVYLLFSIVGTAAATLSLSYVLQVYTALHRRNSLGIQVELATAETGDAAELLAGLGPEGELGAAESALSELATETASVKESHHFYPLLFYFRFDEPYYSVSRTALVLLDAVTLIKSGLDDGRYRRLMESAAVDRVWRGALMLLTTLEETFLASGPADGEGGGPDAATRERWRRRYFAGLRRLRQAGIDTAADEQAGAENYLALRALWDPHVARLAPTLAYDLQEIDAAGSAPEASDHRRDFRARLHAAG